MTRRFLAAIAAYAVLALLAFVTLAGNIRLATFILLAGLGLKTFIAYLAHR